MAMVSVLRHAVSGFKPGVWTAALTVGCAAAVSGPVPGLAQSPVQIPPSASISSNAQPTAKSATATAHKHPSKRVQAAKLKPAPAVVPVAAPLPPPPDWPANNKAQLPSVSWNGRDLTIAASNSSLKQILTDVSTATGVKVEGEESDQRIFGSYGPAPARDVLSQLLDGSGYNVLIIGDKGEGTPRQLVLTAKTHIAPQSPGGNAQARQNSEDDAPEEPEPPPEQPNNPIQHRPFNGQPGRTPEQMQQEQQQRMQQLQQQQQNQPPPPPQPPPTPNN
jgi:hypothetical protein